MIPVFIVYMILSAILTALMFTSTAGFTIFGLLITLLGLLALIFPVFAIIGIVNAVGSSIARETDTGVYIHVGPEIGVASTKAFTGQVTVLTLLALALGHEQGTLDDADHLLLEHRRHRAGPLGHLPALRGGFTAGFARAKRRPTQWGAGLRGFSPFPLPEPLPNKTANKRSPLMPTVTVIIPVYKVERYLDACVESVVRQSYADLEILLVDDGSPDRCPALCDAWAEKDPRIKVIHRENGGLSAARNSGIDAAMGEFLLFVDSDDLLEPDAVRRAVDAQRQQDADLVIFNLTYVDEENRPLPQPDFSGFTDEILDEDGVWQRCFALAETRIYYVVAWNKLYRRSLFQHLRYAPGKRYEDQFLLPHLLAQCKTIACLAAPGYRYVQRSGSIMAQGSSRTYLDRPEYLLDWCAYFTQKGDALRAEGLLNDAIQNLAEKQCFDLSTPAQQARYRAACRACADSYTALAAATGQRSMRLRAALLRIGLPAYQAFLKHKT